MSTETATHVLDCPECGEQANRVSRLVLWAETYSFKVVHDDEDQGESFAMIEIVEESESDCKGSQGREHLHCPNGHEWTAPDNLDVQ